MPEPAHAAFLGLGSRIGDVLHLSPREALACMHDGGTVLLDVRDGLERNGRSFAVEHVIEIPWRRIEELLDTVPRGTAIIVADCVGIHSKEVLQLLQRSGLSPLANLVGGMVDWEGDGLPTNIDKDEELAGGCACRLRPSKMYRPRSGC
jgi:rhodanese-related sulfurtransferase